MCLSFNSEIGNPSYGLSAIHPVAVGDGLLTAGAVHEPSQLSAGQQAIPGEVRGCRPLSSHPDPLRQHRYTHSQKSILVYLEVLVVLSN